jgi:hypothetical protein
MTPRRRLPASLVLPLLIVVVTVAGIAVLLRIHATVLQTARGGGPGASAAPRATYEDCLVARDGRVIGRVYRGDAARGVPDRTILSGVRAEDLADTTGMKVVPCAEAGAKDQQK